MRTAPVADLLTPLPGSVHSLSSRLGRIKVLLRIATACLAALVLAAPGPSGAEEAAARVPSPLDEVRALQEEGKHEATLPLLDELLRDAPDSREALGLRANANAELGRQKESLDDFQRFLELDASADEFLAVATVIVKAFAVVRPIPDLVGPPGEVTAPVLVYKESPDVPPSVSRGSRLMFMALIQANGRVKDVKLHEARGLPKGPKADTLTEAVTAALLEYRYVPATQDGKPTAVLFTMVFDFR